MMANYRYILYLHLVFYLFLRGDFFDGNILSELRDLDCGSACSEVGGTGTLGVCGGKSASDEG